MIKNMDVAAREKMINDVELPDNYHDYTTQRGLFVRRDYVLYELVKYLHDKQLMSPEGIELKFQIRNLVGSDLTKYQEKLIDDDYLVEADVEFINYHAEWLTDDYINYISNIVLHSHRVLIMMIQNMTPADYNGLLQSRTVPRNFRSYELGIPYVELPEHVRYSIATASMTHILRRQISKGLIRPMVSERNLPAVHKVELPKEVKQSAAATSAIPLINMLFTSYKGIKYPSPRDDLTPELPPNN